MSNIISIIAIALVVLLTTINYPAVADITTNFERGAAVFKANCAGCHAQGGNIVRRGKNLKLKALHKNKVDTQAAIALLVANGKNNMSAFKDRLTEQQIKQVATYVLQQAENNWK